MEIAPPSGRAVRLHGRRDLRSGPAARPVPGADQVVVRVRAVGLCGSDLHWFDEGGIGETPLGAPLVLGHELAGVIEDGPRAGERVALDPADTCERCEMCRSGRGRLCSSIRFAGLAPDDGGLQTWLAWPASGCFPVPDAMSFAEATLLEVAGIALHAADLAGILPGMRLGVYGAGPIGLVLIRVLRALGASEIVATDLLPHRVAAALASGATEAYLVPGEGPDPAAEVAVDIAFECAGTAAAMVTACRAVRPTGRVLVVGIPEGDTGTYPASAARRKELVIQMVRRMEGPDLPRAIALVEAGRLSLAGLVSDVFPLDQAAAAFERAAGRGGLKVVVEP